MPTSREAIFRSRLAATALVVTAIIATGCSGGSVTPTTSLSQFQQAAGARLAPAAYTFTTIDNDKDPTFNQLLGINTGGTIAGYYGSGSAKSPNKGYTVVSPYAQADFTSENYPGSVQTQVTCINNNGDTGGFWVDSKGVNRGFIRWKGAFTSYTDPNVGKGTVTQILGLNNAGIAVGFYTNGAGVNFGFELNEATGKFTPIKPPGATNVTAAAIDNEDDITGFYSAGTQTIGFIKVGSSYSTFEYPSSNTTITAGINDHRNIVGAYVDSKGKMHGFLLKEPIKNAMWTSIDDPKGVGSTFINGINDKGDMVGFYGPFPPATHGMLITP
jgi:hypothetical protein